jgi:hypothetical protein
MSVTTSDLMKRQVIGCVLFGAPDPLPPVKNLSEEEKRERECVCVRKRDRERASERQRGDFVLARLSRNSSGSCPFPRLGLLSLLLARRPPFRLFRVF